jgi:hypothetical protein
MPNGLCQPHTNLPLLSQQQCFSKAYAPVPAGVQTCMSSMHASKRIWDVASLSPDALLLLLLSLAACAAATPAESLTGHPLVLGSYDEAVFEVGGMSWTSFLRLAAASSLQCAPQLPGGLACCCPCCFPVTSLCHFATSQTRYQQPFAIHICIHQYPFPVVPLCCLLPTSVCNHSPAMTCGNWQQHSCSHCSKSCAASAPVATVAAKHASTLAAQTAWTPHR